MSGRRPDVSATQALSSMLAAITGAIAASGLGIAGTLVGAAFMSLASTVGAAVYRHYISRSNERLKAAAASLAPKASGSVVAAALVRHHQAPDADSVATTSQSAPAAAAGRAAAAGAGDRAAADSSRLTATRQAASPPGSAAPETGSPAAMPDWAYAADAAGTTVMPAAAGRAAEGDPADDVTRTWFRDTTPGNGARPGAHADTATAVTRPGASAAAAGPRPGATVPGSPAPRSADHGAQPPGSDGTRDPAGRRRRWLISALAAVSVFVIAMGAVTAIEAIAGKPLETVVWHKKGSGTTIGGLVDGPAAHRHSRPGPTTSPSAPASPSSTPATTPPATPTPTPTGSGSTTPSPTPTPASPAPSGSGAAG
ncbi:MAG TPA: hypothetical protein VGG35_10965 [Streptosporangiaceae bacterium]